jgi:diguanylate cyclase (GGDEF)-like protein
VNATLLLVDDDPNIIRLLHEALRGLGQFFFATDGTAGLSVARERQPDIVLLDGEMPGMDGFELCAALKANPKTADAAIIFVTAHNSIEHETRALDLGAADFVHKPISPPVVRARVRNHLALKTTADDLRRLSNTDPLTGLPNRRTFETALDSEWRRGWRTSRPLAVAMVDIDFFKNYNDFYGHLAGDVCLQAVSGVLREAVRRAGELVARYGGEEFIVLLPDTDIRGAAKFGELQSAKLRVLEIRHAKSSVCDFVTASIGVASIVPGQDTAREALIDAADKALYRAKASGRNRMVADATLMDTLGQ